MYAVLWGGKNMNFYACVIYGWPLTIPIWKENIEIDLIT